jgi:putative CocE/NonD family hydrolase
MRDGISLAANLIHLQHLQEFPVIILRTPYGREALSTLGDGVDPVRAAAEGYGVLLQDVRGRGESSGTFDGMLSEGNDGVDTVAWVKAQPWCNGYVGMLGGSYVGCVQLQAATARPRSINAIVPQLAPIGGFSGSIYTQAGVMNLGLVASWISLLATETLTRIRLDQTAPSNARFRYALEGLLSAPPLDRVRILLRSEGSLRDVFRVPLDWISHDILSDYWRPAEIRGRISMNRTPGLHIGGWYDAVIDSTIDAFHEARTGVARNDQHLLVGPWTHSPSLLGSFREVDFGPYSSAASIDLMGQQLAFLAHHLRAQREERPPARVFLMRANRWLDLDDWPPIVEHVHYYLHSSGRANSHLGEGVLTQGQPEAEKPDTFVYDPANPVPTVGGQTALPGMAIAANAGPRDQSRLEGRSDVLLYQTDPLSRPVDVVGRIELVLYAATSAMDTDFTAKLVDIQPDGRSLIVCDGIVRIGFRGGLEYRIPVPPRKVLEYRVRVGDTCYRFDNGHRIGLHISSSNCPKYDPNPNTGYRLIEGALEAPVRAHQEVFHDRERPSHLSLPILRNA